MVSTAVISRGSSLLAAVDVADDSGSEAAELSVSAAAEEVEAVLLVLELLSDGAQANNPAKRARLSASAARRCSLRRCIGFTSLHNFAFLIFGKISLSQTLP